MHKKIYLFIIFTFLLLPSIVCAKKDYTIEDYYISSEVEIAGGIKVKELIVLNGSFSTFTRNIIYKDSTLDDWLDVGVDFYESSFYNAGSIDNLEIYALNLEDDASFDIIDGIDDYATDDCAIDESQYKLTETDYGTKIKINYSLDSSQVAFYIEYVVTNAVVIHEDVAELYYSYVDESFGDNINNFNLRVFIPQPDTSELFNLWVHGKADATVNKYTNDDGEIIGMVAQADYVKAYTGVNVRLTFDKSIIMIDNFLNHSNVEALDKITEVEKERETNTNISNRIKKVLLIMNICYVILLICLWLYIYLGFSRKNKADNITKSSDIFIKESSIEDIEYLLKKRLTYKSFIAMLCQEIENNKVKVVKINSENYKFILSNNKNNDIKKILFKDKKSITTSNLQKDEDIKSNYLKWLEKSNEKPYSKSFYQKSNTKVYGFLYSFIGLMLIVLNIITNSNIITGYLLIIPVILFIIYLIFMSNKTKLGNTYKKEIKRLKKYLKNTNNYSAYKYVLNIKVTDDKLKDIIKITEDIFKNIN